MKKIDTEKLSKEINDTLIHRQCVMRSGKYLAKYLIHCNRSVDAIRLIGRCQIHDMSKMTNAEEFMALASIVDTIDEMRDIYNEPNQEQLEAKRVHWKNNSHHPEYYDSPNDMTDLDLMEMACDLHARSKQFGTNLLDYVEAQQEIRFHFDNDHIRKLKNYCVALDTLTKADDYSEVLNPENQLHFNLRDSTLDKLEQFDDAEYPRTIKTERLYLEKIDSDFASIVYSVYCLDSHERIGEISIKFNGFIEYKIYQNYLSKGYAVEALKALLNVVKFDEVLVTIRDDNETGKRFAKSLGFEESSKTECATIYRKKKEIKA